MDPPTLVVRDRVAVGRGIVARLLCVGEDSSAELATEFPDVKWLLVGDDGTYLDLHKSGKLRILAHSSGRRSDVAPAIPTFRELGFPIESSGWFGLFAPANTPVAITTRLNDIVIAFGADLIAGQIPLDQALARLKPRNWPWS